MSNIKDRVVRLNESIVYTFKNIIENKKFNGNDR